MDLMQPTVISGDVSLADATRRYKHAVQAVLEAYAERGPAPTDPVTPAQLNAAIEMFFTESLRFDRPQTDSAWANPASVSELGDYAITLLTDITMWAHVLGLQETDRDFDQVAIAFAEWIIAHGGEIRTLDPIVDALARRANQARDRHQLEALTELMTRIARATAASAKLDPTRRHVNESWRLLNFNRGVVVTRTHNPTLMAQVFEDMARELPADAAHFFAEGMQQLDKRPYPAEVHEVMTRYFDRCTRQRMH